MNLVPFHLASTTPGAKMIKLKPNSDGTECEIEGCVYCKKDSVIGIEYDLKHLQLSIINRYNYIFEEYTRLCIFSPLCKGMFVDDMGDLHDRWRRYFELLLDMKKIRDRLNLY